MRVELDLECPRCGEKLLLSEDRYGIEIQCPVCRLSARLSRAEALKRALKYFNGQLFFDWNTIINDLYFEIALSSARR